jgi:hypothetical protein
MRCAAWFELSISIVDRRVVHKSTNLWLPLASDLWARWSYTHVRVVACKLLLRSERMTLISLIINGLRLVQQTA